MNQILTDTEIEKTRNLCFENPIKACAITQIIVDTCQIISCNTFAELKGKSTRTIQYQSNKYIGIKIENRKFISLNQ